MQSPSALVDEAICRSPERRCAVLIPEPGWEAQPPLLCQVRLQRFCQWFDDPSSGPCLQTVHRCMAHRRCRQPNPENWSASSTRSCPRFLVVVVVVTAALRVLVATSDSQLPQGLTCRASHIVHSEPRAVGHPSVKSNNTLLYTVRVGRSGAPRVSGEPG